MLDGETLYEGGFLVTLGYQIDRGETLRQGRRKVADPEASHELATRTSFALQYGLRNDLQIGVALPYVTHDREGRLGELSSEGLGDIELLAKYRFWRWNAPGKALNLAVIGELSLPTGEDDARSRGMRLEPQLQPGSGGVDPALGIGATYEPERWRFNAALLYRWRTDSDGDHARLPNEVVAELAAGNRFWLEPYPGPFMRLDLVLRWYEEHGDARATLGFNYAFRPRPALDIQVGFEVPWWQDVSGTGLGNDWSLDINFGYRF